MSDYYSGKSQRHFLNVFIILCATSLITNNAGVISTADTKRPCGPLDDDRCCGSRDPPSDMDSKCCRYGDALFYVPVEKCDATGFVIGDPMLPCGGLKYHLKKEGCCLGQIYDTRGHQCCEGRQPIPINAVCCHGKALAEGEICCPLVSQPVVRQHPSHANCCVEAGTQNIKTYDDKTEYCNQDSGKVIPNPGLSHFPLPDSQLSPRENKAGSGQTPPAEELAQKKQTGRRDEPHNSGRKKPDITNTQYDLKTWCLNGKELAEGKECCGEQPFHPSVQICCESNLHNIPSKEAQCCQRTAFRKDAPENSCMAMCGSKSFDRQTQICCNSDRVFNVSLEYPDSSICCGDHMINTDTHTCCASQPLEKSKGYECCQNTQPYHRKIMTCDRATGTVELKDLPFRSSDICHRRLVRWGDSWRQVTSGTFHFRGRVERCGVKVRPHSVTIPLTPVITLVGGHEVSDCLRGTLKLVIKIRGQRPCMSDNRMRRYLAGTTLDVHVSSQEALECRGRRSKLVITDGDNATILISREIDSLFKDILRP